MTSRIEGNRARPLGDAWAWSRKGSTVDISPLYALPATTTADMERGP